MKKKKNIILICVSFILLICIGAFFLFNKTDELIILKEPVENSMYDYIMDTMAASQDGYTVDMIPYYETEQYQEIAKEKMPNGNGWFYDEERNVFYRGYLYRLVLDFEHNKAWNEKIDVYDPLNNVENRESTYTKTQEWDFENRIYIDSTGVETKFKDELDSYAFDEKGEYIWNEDGTHKMKMYSDYFEKEFLMEDAMRLMPNYTTLLTAQNYHIEKMMYLYNKQFEDLGCPLYGVSTSDLKKYQYKEFTGVEKTSTKSNKINAPWELDYYVWDSSKDGKVEYLNNISDILDVEVPVSEYYTDGYENCFGKYIFLIKGGIGDRYNSSSPDRILHTNTDGGFYDTLPQAMMEYIYKPALTKLYGVNPVYYYDLDKVISENGNAHNLSIEDIRNNNITDSDHYIGRILNISNGDTVVATDIYGELFTQQFFNRYFSPLDKYFYSKEYTAKDWPFTDDYFFNFLCLYSYDYQNSMGLR